MSKYSELVYMVLDEIKGMSDDFTYTEDHVIFLLDKTRALLLKQRYSDIKKQIPESNYQTICLNLIQVPAVNGECCEGGSYLRSKSKIPFLMQIATPKVYPLDYYKGEITYVSRDRMRYVGNNKYLKNIIYCSIAPDGYLYFKSSNPQFLYLEKVSITGIFQDAKAVAEMQLNCSDSSCSILDRDFPIEDALVPPLIELVVKELLGATYRPEDSENNAHDDLEGLEVKNK